MHGITSISTFYYEIIANSNFLKGINVFISDQNNWQGLIHGEWPYEIIPSKISALFIKNRINAYFVFLQEHQWNFKTGYKNFDLCWQSLKSPEENCSSIFDPSIKGLSSSE